MLKLRGGFLVLLAVFTNPCFSQADGPSSLAAKIEAVIDSPDYRQARWGILVVDSQSGETLYARDADRLFMPASTTKLFSCSTALAVLGPEYKFETPVYRRGEVKDGKLEGDLILVAQGDLTLGGRTDATGHMQFRNFDHTYAGFFPDADLTDTDPLAGLKELAKQVAAAGIRHVEGDVLIDGRLFEKGRGSGSGPELLTPIVVNDNVIDVRVTPGEKAGEPAKAGTRPLTRSIQIDTQVETVAEDKKASIEIRSGGPGRLLVTGRIPVKSKPVLRIFPVGDPAQFARALFIEALSQAGVQVKASPVQEPRAQLPEPGSYQQLTRVALFTSPPFSELLKVTLKVSHNLYANTFPLLVAVKNGKRSLSDGLHVQRKFLADLGVPVDTISFGGGAGASPADLVTPRATVHLLGALAKRSDFPILQAALPVLGVDGTLATAVKGDSPARGKVRAKTGTYVWHDAMNDRGMLRSKALAGIMTTAGGRELTLAMFVNDVPLPKEVTSSREGQVLGKLCEIIYQDQAEHHK
jgi:D-alanyl-D-alanine carboxypeptidase/D-alanyl-D-alanine-endopeptidase (penicillin-binding protein 4)